MAEANIKQAGRGMGWWGGEERNYEWKEGSRATTRESDELRRETEGEGAERGEDVDSVSLSPSTLRECATSWGRTENWAACGLSIGQHPQHENWNRERRDTWLRDSALAARCDRFRLNSAFYRYF